MAIPGISSMTELEQDVAVADIDWVSPPDEIAKMEQIKEEVGKIFCRSCNYCQPCPENIPISDVLRSMISLKRYGPAMFTDDMVNHAVERVENCLECRECETRCPYKLSIPELLKENITSLKTALGK